MKRIVALFIALLLLGAVLLAGCLQQAPQQTADQSNTAGSSPTTSTTKKEIPITLYFVEERDGAMFLVPENRTVPETKSIAKATLEELIGGTKQQGLTSLIPSETKVRSINIVDNLATVDFSKEILKANVGSTGEVLGIAQIVNTLTEFPSIERVKFMVEGKEKGTVNGRDVLDWWGHIGLSDQPFSRREDLMRGGRVSSNTIKVESPLAFSSIESPFTVRGKAQAFEAQFHVRVIDKNNTVLADIPVMADDYNWGNFNEQITYSKPEEPGRGTVLFYFGSAEDGREIPMASITVFLK